MSVEEVVDRLKSDKEALNKWVGVYIGVLAVLLAICNVGGANAAKDATRANIEASNAWAFYQAKNIRRVSFTLAADQLELMQAAQQALAAPAKKSVEDKMKSYRAEADRLKRDQEDGLDVLLAKARALEAERDVALRKDPYFDWSQALLQIAIVLASVHLIIGNLMLLGLSGGLSGLGVLLMINGYTLLVRLPLLG
jgi:nitroreductase